MRSPSIFELLYREHIRRVLGLLRRVGVHKNDIEDAGQEIFLALFRALPGLDLTSPLDGWIGTATCRVARDHLKRARREQVTDEGEIDPAEQRRNPEQRAMIAEAHRELQAVLDEMAPPLRIVFVFSEIDDMAMPLIAEALEIPIGTGYTRLRAAREEFDAIVGRRRAQRRSALGIMPLFLMDPNVLLGLGRSPSKADDAAGDRLWQRLVQALGPALHPALPARAPTKAQLAVSHGAAIVAGGGAGAVIALWLMAHPAAVAVTADPFVRAAGAPASTGGAAMIDARDAGEAATTDGGAGPSDGGRPDSGAAAVDPETAERFLIQSAMAALHQSKPDPVRALRVLARHEQQFPQGKWAPEREALKAEAQGMTAHDRAEDGGTP